MGAKVRAPVPLIDLFSGPGGLAEGFTSIGDHADASRFRVALSIEMDPAAYLTLRLRAFLRNFRSDLPPEYYDYLNGKQSEDPDWSVLYPEYWTKACDETRCLQLGTAEAELVLRRRIRKLRKAHRGRTLLLGGPPCQSYSLAGRVRNAGKPGYDPNKDERQSLYLEYAKALRLLRPAVAVMENVRGILSARHHGRPVFPKIMDSLRHAGAKDQYQLFALTPDVDGRLWRGELEPEDFLVRAEQHGVPQTRHRVFVICIRRDVANALPEEALPSLKPCKTTVNVEDVIGNMPVLRSRLSRSDCGATWQGVLRDACALVEQHQLDMNRAEGRRFRKALRKALTSARGVPLAHADEIGGTEFSGSCPASLRDWLFDANVTTLPNNETRRTHRRRFNAVPVRGSVRMRTREIAEGDRFSAKAGAETPQLAYW